MKRERVPIKRFAGKLTSMILGLTLCVTSFTGCGKKAGSTEAFGEATEIDKNCIYKQEELTGILGDGDSVVALGNKGGKVMVITQTGEGTFKYSSFNPDGSDVQSHDIGGKKEDYIAMCDFDAEGNAYMVFKDNKSDDVYDTFLLKIDPSGAEVSRTDITGEYSEDPFFLGSMTWTDKYGLVCGSSKGIMSFDEQSGFTELVGSGDLGNIGDIRAVTALADNKLFVNAVDSSSYSQTNVLVDLEKKKVEKKLEGFQNDSYYTFFADENGQLYATDYYAVYKYDLASAKLEKLLNYRDSAIDAENISTQAGLVAINENEFIADITSSSDSADTITKMVKVNPEDVVDKTIITLSVMYLDPDIESQINAFNRTSDKYTIKTIDYSEQYGDGSDYDQVQKQFNLDITSGKIADIICFSGNEASIKKYADKGILLDLSPAFEKGGPLGDIELLPNIAEMNKYDGKTYTFMPTFNFSTFVVKSEYAQGKQSLTYKDCDDLITSKSVEYKNAFGSYNDRDSVCATMWLYYGDYFLDLKNKKCNFNSPEFIEFLNFVNKIPARDTPVDVVNGYEIDQEYIEEKSLFYPESFRDIWEYAKLKQVVFNSDIELIGSPNNTGKNLAAINGATFAVNSKTEHLDAIYDLIKDMLTSDKKAWNGFSTVKANFEKQIQEGTKEPSEDNQNATVMDPVTAESIKLKPLSQEDVQKFYDYATSINTPVAYDSQIANIILEESSAFFSGQKTAEEASEIIQKRVSVYINENS